MDPGGAEKALPSVEIKRLDEDFSDGTSGNTGLNKAGGAFGPGGMGGACHR